MAAGIMQFHDSDEDQATGFGGALAKSIALRLAQAQAEKAEDQAPFVSQNAKADALQKELMNRNQENVNKYYAPNIQSQISERGANTKYLGAETSLKELERQYPNIKDSGIKGDMDRRRFLIDHQSRMKNQQPQSMAQSLTPLIQERAQQQPGSGNIAQSVSPAISDQQPPVRENFPELVTNKNSPYKQLEQQGLINNIPGQEQGIVQPREKPFNEIAALERNINADIGGKEALAKYHERALGQGRGGVNIQQQAKLMEDLKRDNPSFTDEEAFEAAGNLVDGKQTMDDGSPFKASGLTRKNASKVALQSTTSSLATNLVQGKQAESEINVLSKFALEGIKPYGETYFNKSPDQIYDSLSNDSSAQKKLGRLIAAKQLQYEIAQNETKLAGGQPGVTNTQELMNLGQQSLDTHFPHLSYEAREEAQRYFLEALKQGFKARQKVGTAVNNATAISEESPVSEPINPSEQSSPTAKWVRKDGKLVRVS